MVVAGASPADGASDTGDAVSVAGGSDIELATLVSPVWSILYGELSSLGYRFCFCLALDNTSKHYTLYYYS